MMKGRGLYASLAFLVFLFFASFYISQAADADTQTGGVLPEEKSAGDLVNTAKQIGGEAIEKGVGIVAALSDTDLSKPASVWSSADGWFLETTGIHIVDAFKDIGHFVVWFLELVLGLFKWLLILVE